MSAPLPEPAGVMVVGAAAGDAAPRRLHAFSWLFVLLTKLRPFVLPALLLLVLGTGTTWELWGAVGAVVLSAYALVYSFGFRYRLLGDELHITEGVLFRTERHIPFARVQSVVQRRNALHRLFGVTELRLESSGGSKPEAVMSVISLGEAERLERVLRAATPPAAQAPGAEAPALVPPQPLFGLQLPEVLRLGLISSRGWVVVSMAIGLYWQFAPDSHGGSKVIGHWLQAGFDLWRGEPVRALQGLGVVLAGILGVAVLLKPVSMVMTLFLFHGFRLVREPGRLTTNSGLLTQRSASARSERIQRLVLQESLLARLLGRRTLACDVALHRQEQNADDLSRLHWLGPIGTPEQLEHLVGELAPELRLQAMRWQPLHARAWKRMWKESLVVAAIVMAVLAWPLQHLVFVPGLAIALYGWFAARGSARFSAYALHDGVFAFRSGWHTRAWTMARVEKGHAVSLQQSPFDRRAGMASVQLDTAGAGSQLELRVPYLGMAEARGLQAALVAQVAAADQDV